VLAEAAAAVGAVLACARFAPVGAEPPELDRSGHFTCRFRTFSACAPHSAVRDADAQAAAGPAVIIACTVLGRGELDVLNQNGGTYSTLVGNTHMQLAKGVSASAPSPQRW
jgi:hypothetical protein